MERETIAVVDFGGQYTHLIARRIRELQVYCEVIVPDGSQARLHAMKPRGIILSGGPSSVYDKGAPTLPKEVFEMGTPILGICYGLHLMASSLGGHVVPSGQREFGAATLLIKNATSLFKGFKSRAPVWMSHGDSVKRLPAGFEELAYTENTPLAAIANHRMKLFGVQFHPEVAHTPQGKELLKNFLFEICRCRGDWTPASFVDREVSRLKEMIGKERVLCGLSGGVDSTVAAVLIHRAIGNQLQCVFVNNGLLRQGEPEQVIKTFQDEFKIPLRYVDASEPFLTQLAGVTDPEEKRRRIGHTFIEVFEREAKAVGECAFLGQGTLYPDVIESTSTKGPSATIKTHHNVGGLPADMKFRLVEPLRELFKDEVRRVGRALGIPEAMVSRHPFPGPGLAVRIVGEVTKLRLQVLREVEAIVEEEVRAAGWYDRVWQAFAVLLPTVRSVGVMGDYRTYEQATVVRVVHSDDGMTADWAKLPHDLLGRISTRIVNEVKGINRVVYDISSKPPSTIEWE